MALSRKVPISLGIVGAFTVLLAVVLQYYGFHALLIMELKQVYNGADTIQMCRKKIHRSNVPLIKGSQMWNIWQKTPIPVYVKFWIFNVTNPDDVIKGEKPILNEMGPYTYLEEREKLNITFHDEDDTVSYLQNTLFRFQPHLSNGTEEDDVTIVNVPLVGAAVNFPAAQDILNTVLKGERLFYQKKAGDFLFHGIDVSDYLRLLKLVPNFKIPPELKTGFFSIYGQKNNTNDDRFRVYRGIKDLSKFTIIKDYNGSPKVTAWNDRYCDMVNGTDGTNFPPLLQKDTILYTYLPDACRDESSLYAVYEKEVQMNGIPGYRFVIPKKLLESPAENPDNACYFKSPNNGLPSGVISMVSCRGGPMSVSFPHFLYADPSLVDAIGGLHPNKENHESFMELEPTSAALLRGETRIQLNIQLQANKIDDFKNLKPMVFPMFWLSGGAQLEGDFESLIKNQIVVALTVMDILGWVLLAIGSVLILAAFLAYRKHKGVSKV